MRPSPPTSPNTTTRAERRRQRPSRPGFSSATGGPPPAAPGERHRRSARRLSPLVRGALVRRRILRDRGRSVLRLAWTGAARESATTAAGAGGRPATTTEVDGALRGLSCGSPGRDAFLGPAGRNPVRNRCRRPRRRGGRPPDHGDRQRRAATRSGPTGDHRVPVEREDPRATTGTVLACSGGDENSCFPSRGGLPSGILLAGEGRTTSVRSDEATPPNHQP